jgi:hypothetical protein
VEEDSASHMVTFLEMFISDSVFNRSDYEDNEAHNLLLSTSSLACSYNICPIFKTLHLISPFIFDIKVEERKKMSSGQSC